MDSSRTCRCSLRCLRFKLFPPLQQFKISNRKGRKVGNAVKLGHSRQTAQLAEKIGSLYTGNFPR
jgi:hypothetical protein